MKDLRKLNNISGINVAASGSAISNLLLELDLFIESKVHVEAEDIAFEEDGGEQEEISDIESENEEVNAKINEMKDKLKVVKREVDYMDNTYKKSVEQSTKQMPCWKK